MLSATSDSPGQTRGQPKPDRRHALNFDRICSQAPAERAVFYLVGQQRQAKVAALRNIGVRRSPRRQCCNAPASARRPAAAWASR